MCRSHWAHSRRDRSNSESDVEQGPPHWGSGWQEYFMRGGHRGGPFGGPGFGRHGGDEDGGGFGVRRPLRFLADRLGLDEKQVGALAKILDELKTERAQVAVDDRRSLADFAEAIAGETFDAARAASAGDRRVTSAQKLRDSVGQALSQIHALLSPEQRAKLAYMIRTGVLAL
jgi:Spy/CpxP family protein refolding chaperone